MWSQFELIQYDNSNEGLVKSDVKITRVNRTTQSMKGTVEYTSDLSNDFDASKTSTIHSEIISNSFSRLKGKYFTALKETTNTY